MKYPFPIITHINDVLPHIEGRKEFVVAERGYFTVVNYQVQTPGTFSRDEDGWEIRRECRGITFYADGTVAARKFHKFFNVGEREETQLQNIDLTQGHVILEKLDGSMITPFLRDEKIEYHTKMGLTDVAGPANEFAHSNGFYDDFCYDLIQSGLTPIFEWMSRKNRIVIDYGDDSLVLLAVRENVSGKYKSYGNVKALAEPYKVPVVQQHEATFDADFMEYVRGLIGVEGFVVAFADGSRVKIKAEDYLKLHKAKEAISQEKNVWALILDADVDDLKGFLSDEDRVRIEQFESVLWEQVQLNVDWIETCWNDAERELGLWAEHEEMFADFDRERKKHFATQIVPAWPARYTSIAFKMYEGKDARDEFLKFVRSNLGTGTKLDKMRSMFNDIKFDDQEEE